MTKGKAFMTVFGVLAAAGAVITSVMMKNRGKIQVQGEIETRGNRGIPGRGKGVRGQATVNATHNRPSQT
jgi:hypothetical protein